jgi:hypothetical protein
MKDMEETQKKGAEGVSGKAMKLSGKRTVSRHVSGEPKGTEGANFRPWPGRNLSGKKQRNKGFKPLFLFLFV